MKKVTLLIQSFTLLVLSIMCFNCSDPDVPTPEPQPEPEPEPTLTTKDLAGLWSANEVMGQWIIDTEGNVRIVLQNHLIQSTKYKRPLVYVSVEDAFRFDLNINTDSVLSKIEEDTTIVTKFISYEPKLMSYVDTVAKDTTTLFRDGDYCAVAPETIVGYQLSARDNKVHGLRFGANSEVFQDAYVDEVVDVIYTSYTYTKGEDNKAHLSYHITYRLNPDKIKEYTGKNSNYSDITYDIIGEIDLTFLSHEAAGKFNDENYYGETNGNVSITTTDNKSGMTRVVTVNDNRIFSLTKI